MLLHNLITLADQGRLKRTFSGGGRLGLKQNSDIFYNEFKGLYLPGDSSLCSPDLRSLHSFGVDSFSCVFVWAFHHTQLCL